MRKPWTEKELEYLEKNAKRMTYEQIGKKLGRTANSISIKASRMNINGGTWTKEEDEYIETHAGTKTLEAMAKRLRRTPAALRVHMNSLGIGDLHMEKGTYSAKALGEIIGSSHETVRRWIHTKGLPATKISRYENVDEAHMRYHIAPEDFWQWAEQHRDLVHFNRIEPRSLPPEPDWLAEEKRKQFYRPAKQRMWEPEEDQRLLRYYYVEALRQIDIAEEMGRTLNSVEKRLKRLREK